MYLGRYKLGEWIPLSVQCTDENGDAVAPDSAPTVTVYDGDFASVVSGKTLPAKDVSNRTGMFEIEGRLASGFSEGVHHALFVWLVVVTRTGRTRQCSITSAHRPATLSAILTLVFLNSGRIRGQADE